MTLRRSTALALLAVLAAPALHAADADFDATFGSGGRSTVSFDVQSPFTDSNAAVFNGADNAGLWIIGEARTTGSTGLLAIARLNAVGGQIFKRTLPITIYDVATAQPAPDGGAYVLMEGTGQNGVDVLVARLTPSGMLDPAFSGDGVAGVGLALGKPLDLAVAPGGTVEVAYRAANVDGTSGLRGIARFSPTGALQSSLAIGSVEETSTTAMVAQPDGKLIVVVPRETTPCTLRVFRFLAAAQATPYTYDPAFSAPTITLGTGPCFAYPRDVRVDPEGRIVIAVAKTGAPEELLMRLLPGGALDTSFSNDGMVQFNTLVVRPRALGIQSDGRIVIGGERGDTNGDAFVVCRFTVQGNPDQAFATNNSCTSFPFLGQGGIESPFNKLKDMAILSGDRIVVAGTMEWAAPSDFDFAVARLKGSDRTFASGFE